MPARRLPWVKLWPELMEREKVRLLSDSHYRTWTYCLLASSQLPIRWRFDSVEHAAYLTRRPVKEIRSLVAVHFLEVRDDGVWLHDVDEYQDVYPSDIDRERSAKTPPNTPPTLGEHSANGRTKAPRTVVNGSLETGEGRREIETGDRDVDSAPSERAPRLSVVRESVSKPNRSAEVIDAIRDLGVEPTLTERDHAAIKRSNAKPEQIAEVYCAVFRGEYGDDFMQRRLAVHEAIGWVDGYRSWKISGTPKLTRNGQTSPPRRIIDHTGKINSGPVSA